MMSFCEFHQTAQKEIRAIERRKAKARALAMKEKKATQGFIQDFKAGRITGFANPTHDAFFKLAVTVMRSLRQ